MFYTYTIYYSVVYIIILPITSISILHACTGFILSYMYLYPCRCRCRCFSYTIMYLVLYTFVAIKCQWINYLYEFCMLIDFSCAVFSCAVFSAVFSCAVFSCAPRSMYEWTCTHWEKNSLDHSRSVIPSFRLNDNSVHFHKCSPFWVGIFITFNKDIRILIVKALKHFYML